MAKGKKTKKPAHKKNDGSIPALITEHVSKKGKLKTSDKSQTIYYFRGTK